MAAEHRVRWGASRGEQGGAAVGTGSLQPCSSLGLGPHAGGEGGDGSGASGELCKELSEHFSSLHVEDHNLSVLW